MNRFFRPAAADTAISSGYERDLWLASCVLFVISFLPTTVFYLGGTTSHATGVVTASGLLALIYGTLPTRPRLPSRLETWLIIVALTTLAIVVHLLVATLFNQTAFGRAALSLMVLAALLMGAFFAFASLNRVGDAALNQAAVLTRIAFVIIAVFGIIGLQPIGSSELISNEKSAFPFAEPSHFAIAFSPFLLHAGLVYRGWKQILWILIGFGLAYLMKNLSLVLATAVMAMICMPLSRLLPAALALGAVLGSLNLEYFTERLDLSSTSGNQSVLIYRQGWELVADALRRTDGWGIGFQQLGTIPFNSPSADMLYRMLRSDSNILNGGFGAAKLLSEFGMMGIALMGCYIYLLVSLGWKLRKRVIHGPSLPAKLAFSGAVVCGFSVEFFVRGLGYFSGTTLLLIAALLLMKAAGKPAVTDVDARPQLLR